MESAFPYAMFPHHEEAKWNTIRVVGGAKCQTTTLYMSCASLSIGKWNTTCTSHHKVMGMWLYKWRWKRFKWKDSKTFNVESQVQVNANGVGIRKGIGLRWSQGFGLDDFNVW
jgi:hypothetical protein